MMMMVSSLRPSITIIKDEKNNKQRINIKTSRNYSPISSLQTHKLNSTTYNNNPLLQNIKKKISLLTWINWKLTSYPSPCVLNLNSLILNLVVRQDCTMNKCKLNIRVLYMRCGMQQINRNSQQNEIKRK